MTSRSPGRAAPSLTAASHATSTISCSSATSRTGTGCTPHTRASRRAVSRKGVSARIGTAGRSRAARSAEKPDEVYATTTGVESTRAAPWRA